MRLMLVLFLELAVLFWNCGTQAAAEVSDGESSSVQQEDTTSGWMEELKEISGLLDLERIDQEISELPGNTEFSFADTFQKLLHGEIPFDIKELPGILVRMFLSELEQQRRMALQILIIVLASAIFSNFIRVFNSSQIADISFYMMYLLICGLLIHSFMAMNQIVLDTCSQINSFMKILLPVYVGAVVLCAGSISALGFYEVTLLGINLTQNLVIRMVLPVINFYLVLLILNQMSEEDYFSRFADLLEMGVGWVLKTVTGLVVGLQAVQCLVTPSVDALKSTSLQRLAKAIPGIGGLLDSAAETVGACALVIKNAAGTAGILALLLICMLPLVKLAVCIFIFRLLCAFIQPVSERRMVEGIGSISRSAVLLLKILVMNVSVFVISIAMVTSSVKGG